MTSQTFNHNKLFDIFIYPTKTFSMKQVQQKKNTLKLRSISIFKQKKLFAHLLSNYKELNFDVITCQEAAKAKGIPLENELKSLIITTSNGLYLLHIPGNKNADWRKVKKHLGVKEACLASKEILTSLGVSPGRVCPFANDLWNLPQLITTELLQINRVTTNNGEFNKYIEFNANVLINSRLKIKLGTFIR